MRMDKQKQIDAVRVLFLAGEIETINVYYRLEHLLSAAQISALLREWKAGTR